MPCVKLDKKSLNGGTILCFATDKGKTIKQSRKDKVSCRECANGYVDHSGKCYCEEFNRYVGKGLMKHTKPCFAWEEMMEIVHVEWVD